MLRDITHTLNFNLKELILAFLAVSTSAVAFWLWQDVAPQIVAGEFGTATVYLASIATLVLAALFFSLGALFIKGKYVLYPAVVASMALAYFFMPPSGAALGALALGILLAAFAAFRIHEEYELSLGFSITKFLKSGLPIYFTAFSIIVSVFFLGAIPEDKAIVAIFPKSAFTAALEVFGKSLTSLGGLQGLDLNATVDEAIRQLLVEQFEAQKIPLGSISKIEFEKLILAQRDEFAKNFGLKLSGKEQIADIFYTALTQRLETLLGPYKVFLPYAAAVTFFFALKTLTIPLYYLALLTTFASVKLMLTLGILSRRGEQLMVERIALATPKPAKLN